MSFPFSGLSKLTSYAVRDARQARYWKRLNRLLGGVTTFDPVDVTVPLRCAHIFELTSSYLQLSRGSNENNFIQRVI